MQGWMGGKSTPATAGASRQAAGRPGGGSRHGLVRGIRANRKDERRNTPPGRKRGRRKGEYVIVHGEANKGNRRFDDALRGWCDDQGHSHIQIAEPVATTT